MIDLATATRDQMRAEAAALKIAGRGKMTKDELTYAIATVYNQAQEHSEPPTPATPQPVGTFTTVDSEGEQRTARGYLCPEAEAIDLFFQREADGIEVDMQAEPKPLPMTPKRQAKQKQQMKAYGAELGERGKVDGKVMGLHYRGRAVGLKHIQAMGLAEGRTIGQRTPKRQMPSRLPNSERVVNYARANCPHGCGAACRPKLTNRQMRRVRKNANRHNEGFTYAGARSQLWGGVIGSRHSLLARTPEGLGIFYTFSEGE